VRLDDRSDLFALRIGQSQTFETHWAEDAHRSARSTPPACRPARSTESAGPSPAARSAWTRAPSAGSGVLTGILGAGVQRHRRRRQRDGECGGAETKSDSSYASEHFILLRRDRTCDRFACLF
jgi:hypothetical protein